MSPRSRLIDIVAVVPRKFAFQVPATNPAHDKENAQNHGPNDDLALSYVAGYGNGRSPHLVGQAKPLISWKRFGQSVNSGCEGECLLPHPKFFIRPCHTPLLTLMSKTLVSLRSLKQDRTGFQNPVV